MTISLLLSLASTPFHQAAKCKECSTRLHCFPFPQWTKKQLLEKKKHSDVVGVGRRNQNSWTCGLLFAQVWLQPSSKVTPWLVRHLHGSCLSQFYGELLPSESLPSALRRPESTWFVAFYRETFWLFIPKWSLMLLDQKRGTMPPHMPCCFCFPVSGTKNTHLRTLTRKRWKTWKGIWFSAISLFWFGEKRHSYCSSCHVDMRETMCGAYPCHHWAN